MKPQICNYLILLISLFQIYKCNSDSIVSNLKTEPLTEQQKLELANSQLNSINSANTFLQQSPINIQEAVAANVVKPLNQNILKINYRTVTGSFVYEPVGKGNTYKYILPVDDFSHEIAYLDIEKKTTRSYYLRNIHLHVPEEHNIDENMYPIEFHFVHSLKEAAVEDEYSNLVLGVLGKKSIDTESSKLISGISFAVGAQSQLDMSPLKSLSYYYYHGSLTTPPYSENVLWFVFKDVINVGESLISEAKRKIGYNARDIQDLEGEVWIFDNSTKKNLKNQKAK